jgi:hypothetical protein
VRVESQINGKILDKLDKLIHKYEQWKKVILIKTFIGDEELEAFLGSLILGEGRSQNEIQNIISNLNQIRPFFASNAHQCCDEQCRNVAHTSSSYFVKYIDDRLALINEIGKYEQLIMTQKEGEFDKLKV